ncbi:MAG: hypothetical protein ACOZCL_08610 [Bacillota bacterium]
MSIREAVEQEVAAKTGERLTDEVFREAAQEADNDIKFHHIRVNRRTSFQYAVYVTSVAAMILIDINKKCACKSA